MSKSLFKYVLLVVLGYFFYSQSANAQITGLDGWSLFIDPGHSQTENMGLYNYSEAEETLRIGLRLRKMLLEKTDIDTVYISRDSDNDQMSLSQRTDLANVLGADFYYSIHSDAGGTSSNSALMLHGGWRFNGATIEKTPNGGKDLGDIMNTNLPAAMRIPTRGNYADRTFYQGFPFSHDRQYPYLHVNRESNMASLLSEGGHHTNPWQQKNNLNDEWKQLRAQSAFWSILEFMGVDRDTVGIVTGFITDADTDEYLNGATISIEGQTYTTDTYDSLFYKYSIDPEELSNGFYYLEGLTNGANQLIVGGEGYYPDTVDVDILYTDFTFADVAITSSVPPFVAGTSINGEEDVNPGQDLILTFSRSMNKASVEAALTLTPEPEDTLIFNWRSDTELSIVTNNLAFENMYSLTIADSAYDASEYAHQLDGNADGIAGDDYTLDFETGPVDIIPPSVVDIFPTNTAFSVIDPIVSATFSEPLDSALFDSTTIKVTLSNYQVPGEIYYYEVNDQSVINFIPSEKLTPSRNYVLTVSGEISDTLGNKMGSNVVRTFPTTTDDINNTINIDNFDNGLTAWWEPSQSGSTVGIKAEEVSRINDTTFVNPMTNSTSSLKVNYGWLTSETEHLIREYRSFGTPVFGNTYTIQAYVFGDGSGNQFRFMIRDGANQLEGSEWFTVDWIGWKLISWDMTEDEVIGWVNGNGEITGLSHFDSFQLTYVQGQPENGFIAFDDLRAVTYGKATNIEEGISDLPNTLQLDQNYPNPFNPSTNISFALPVQTSVNLTVYDMLGKKVSTLYSGNLSAGYHTMQFKANNLASGVYIYRLETPSEVITKKMLLVK